MIYQIKESFFADKIQFIHLSRSGIIKGTDNYLFDFKEGDSIFDAHPFFESIQYYFNAEDGEEFSIPCVHLNIGENDGIYDIKVYIDKDGVIIALFDFTDHYNESNTLSQEKNESIIQAQLLKEKEEFKNRFLANTSHELRTPLTTIMGFTTILQRSNLSTEQLHYLDIIKASGEHLRNLIDDILDISKIEMGRMLIKHDRFDLKKLCENLEAQYSINTNAKEVKFSIKLDPSIPEFLVGDKLRVNQILTNLLDNAFKFTKRGSIQLNISKLERKSSDIKLQFEVKDTGLGIERDKLDSIFESFIQVHDDPSISGTGLGLSIVRKLVDILDGSISVESTKDVGTTFTFSLPFKVSSNQTKEEIKIEEPKGKSSDKTSILVAEDIEVNQLLIMKILASSGKYFVDIVGDGDQVVERLHQQDYDLILMDIKMPKMDGYDTTRFIRNSEIDAIKNIPIIALTANASPLEREVCLGIGMNEYIGKPYKEEELISKIDRLIKEKKANQ